MTEQLKQQAPKFIYLNIDDRDYIDEATWCQEKISENDIVYIRLDAAPSEQTHIAAAMRDVAEEHAHGLALELECVLSDYSGKWYDSAMNKLAAYREAMNAIHERESPTFMGEPVMPAAIRALKSSSAQTAAGSRKLMDQWNADAKRLPGLALTEMALAAQDEQSKTAEPVTDAIRTWQQRIDAGANAPAGEKIIFAMQAEIKDLRAALAAQPAQQPEQEPVAYIVANNSWLRDDPDYRELRFPKDMPNPAYPGDRYDIEIALYTAPIQPRTLSDAEIELLWARHADTTEAGKRRIAFARAVLAAQGSAKK